MQRIYVVGIAIVVAVVGLFALALWPRASTPQLRRVAAGAAAPVSEAARPPDQAKDQPGTGALDAPAARAARDLDLPAADRLRPQSAGSPPVLSLPLRGGVDPESGAAPTKSSGLVIKGGDVEFTEEAELTIPAGGLVSGQKGTIALEVQPNWGGAEETANSLLQIRNQDGAANALEIVKERNALRFIIRDDQGQESSINAYIDNWQAGENHRVTVTWGEALMKLYLDGTLVGDNTMSNSLHWQGSTPIHVGSDFPGGAFAGANGKMRDVQIYDRALPADEIR